MMESRGTYLYIPLGVLVVYLIRYILRITTLLLSQHKYPYGICLIAGNTYMNYGFRNIGVNEVASTLHWGESGAHNGFMKTHGYKSVKCLYYYLILLMYNLYFQE